MAAMMTVKEARKLLGSNYDEVSDERIEEMVNLLSRIAEAALEDAREKFLCKEL